MTERRLGEFGELTASVVSMNLNGRFKPDETKPLGKAVIQSLLGGTCVQLLFGQQASFSPSSQLPHGFRIIGRESSFIAYDSRLLTPCEPGWQYRRRVHDLTCNNSDDPNNGRLRGLSTLNYVACRLKSKELGIRFVALSWFTDEAVKGKRQRQLVAHKVLSFAHGLAEIEQLPLILAGSFHLSEADACLVLENNSNFRGIRCSGYLANSMRREIRASNLFFCSSSPVELSSVRPRLLRGLVKVGSGSRETFRNPEDAFYHDPVFASIKLLVSIGEVRAEIKTFDLNERFNLISNCQQGLDSIVHSVRDSRTKRQLAGKAVRSASDNLEKNTSLQNNRTNVHKVEKQLDLNNDLSDNVLIQHRRPAIATDRIKTQTSEPESHMNLSSVNNSPQNDKAPTQMLESTVTVTSESSQAPCPTIAGYCIKRSQRELKRVVDLRDCLNRCDIIRGRFSSTERDLTMYSTATDNLSRTADDDDDVTSEILENISRRLSTISEGGESSCSDISAGSRAESLKVFSDDDVDGNSYSEIELIGNARPERRNSEIRIEFRPDFINFSTICNENYTVDRADDRADYGITKYMDTSKQSTDMKSAERATSGVPETTSYESRCQHLALQRSISPDSESDQSFVEHCQTCRNDWRSTFVPVTFDHQLALEEDERFVEGATDSDDSDTYLLADYEMDSECEENKVNFLSESTQGLLDSVPDEKLKKIRAGNKGACALQ